MNYARLRSDIISIIDCKSYDISQSIPLSPIPLSLFSRNRAAYLLLKRLYYYSDHAHSVHRVGVDAFQLTFRSNVTLQSVHYTWSGFTEHNTRKIPHCDVTLTGWLFERARVARCARFNRSWIDFFSRARLARALKRVNANGTHCLY